MSDDGRMDFSAPLYVVAADLGPSDGSAHFPYLLGERQTGTFDEAISHALVGVWYAMHLPKNRFETLELPVLGAQDRANGFPRSHSIALIADSELEDAETFDQLAQLFDPVLIIASSDKAGLAQSVTAAFDFTMPSVSFEQLDQALLGSHWRHLTAAWAADWPSGVMLNRADPPIWSWPIRDDGSQLALQRLSRSMGSRLTELPVFDNVYESAANVRHRRVVLDTLALLTEQGYDQEAADEVFPAAFREMADATRARLTLSLSGIAPKYRRLNGAIDRTQSTTIDDDFAQVRTLLVTHAATADDSMGIVLEDVLNPEAFVELAKLEQHWGGNPRPATVRRILGQLNKSVADIWTDPFVAAVKAASSIDAFTNFPIGLLTLPGDTSPLSARLPISYRPINPLTRALQFELTPQFPYEFASGFKVLIAECIPGSDPVGQYSRRGWEHILDEMAATGLDVEVTITATLSRDSLRAAIVDARPDILVLSAHGFSPAGSNVSGLMVGTDFCLGDDLGRMPPFVVLSACHTSPRGAGGVNVGDLLLRAGAVAVLSTLVPVDVRHNSQTVARLFRYLAQAIADPATEPNTSVMDVWHQVQGLNAVIDLAYSNKGLERWAFGGHDGSSPIARFMNDDHGVPMRRAHLYADVEARLLRVARATGDEERVRSWLQSPGYLPESLMYTMLGRPRSLLLTHNRPGA